MLPNIGWNVLRTPGVPRGMRPQPGRHVRMVALCLLGPLGLVLPSQACRGDVPLAAESPGAAPRVETPASGVEIGPMVILPAEDAPASTARGVSQGPELGVAPILIAPPGTEASGGPADANPPSIPSDTAPPRSETPGTSAAVSNGGTQKPRPTWYNMHAVVSEDFINRYVVRQDVDESPVRDFILGANVFGRQATVSRVAIDIRPCQNLAHLDLRLNGSTSSRTTGVTQDATVQVLGRYEFVAVKSLFFDGVRFWTRQPTIDVVANNQTLCADTRFSRIPLLGGVASRYAFDESERRRPLSEAIARQRLTARVIPQFNSQVDAQLNTLNGQLDREVRTTLRTSSLLPEAEWASSTDTHACYSGALFGETVPPPSPLPAAAVPPSHALSFFLHESYLNEMVERLPIKGATLTDQQFDMVVDKVLEPFLHASMRKLANPANPASPEPDPADQNLVLLDQVQPLRFEIADGIATLVLRAGFQSPGKAPVPTQVVRFPLQMTLEADEVRFRAGRVSVTPLLPPQNEGERVRAAVIRKRIQERLPERVLARRFTLDLPEGGKVTLTTQKADAIEGWLIFAFD